MNNVNSKQHNLFTQHADEDANFFSSNIHNPHNTYTNQYVAPNLITPIAPITQTTTTTTYYDKPFPNYTTTNTNNAFNNVYQSYTEQLPMDRDQLSTHNSNVLTSHRNLLQSETQPFTHESQKHLYHIPTMQNTPLTTETHTVSKQYDSLADHTYKPTSYVTEHTYQAPITTEYKYEPYTTTTTTEYTQPIRTYVSEKRIEPYTTNVYTTTTPTQYNTITETTEKVVTVDDDLPYTVSYSTDAHGRKVETRRYKPGRQPSHMTTHTHVTETHNNAYTTPEYDSFGKANNVETRIYQTYDVPYETRYPGDYGKSEVKTTETVHEVRRGTPQWTNAEGSLREVSRRYKVNEDGNVVSYES